jgi:hypothetical protein
VLSSSEILASSTTMNIYLHLFAISLQGKLVDKNAKIQFKDTTVPMSIIISVADCYVEEESHGAWKLVFPELVLKWVALNSTNQHLSFFIWSILDPQTLPS